MMPLAKFDPTQSPELWFRHHGFDRPIYRLTDSVSNYGELSFPIPERQASKVETLDGTWMMDGNCFTDIRTTTEDKVFIGMTAHKAWSKNYFFAFKGGTKFTFVRPCILINKYLCKNESGQVLFIMNFGLLIPNRKVVFTEAAKGHPHLLFLAFLALKIHLGNVI